MANNESNTTREKINAQPRLHQRAAEIQAYGTVTHLLAARIGGARTIGNDCTVEPTPC